MSDNSNSYKRVRKLLFNEVSFLFSTVAVIFGLYFFITGPQAVNTGGIGEINTTLLIIQKDIETIKTNHLKHIEDDIAKTMKKNNEQDEVLKRIEITIAEIAILIKNTH